MPKPEQITENCEECKTEPAQVHGLCKKCCPCCDAMETIEINREYLTRLLELAKDARNSDSDKKFGYLLGYISALEEMIK